MSKILLFGGTTEARRILESGLPMICSVASEYGAELAGVFPNARLRAGRMNGEEMAEFMRVEEITDVIDATHPYAVEATANIRKACERMRISYLRVVRESVSVEAGGVVPAVSCEEAARLLDGMDGNVLLTVGSKELKRFTSVADYRRRLFARVLPTVEAMKLCEDLGFDAGHVVAMQGPFTLEMNRAMMTALDIRVLVTKDGGAVGGLREKLDAARSVDARVVLIERPRESGCTAMEAVEWARGKLFPRSSDVATPFFPLFVRLAGRSVVVVGGGRVAARRCGTLLACGASVRVVAPDFDGAFYEEALYRVERVARTYDEGDLDGAVLAVAATDDRKTNFRVGGDARKMGIPVNIADAPEECDFFFPALHSEGGVAVAVSSAGESPGLSRRLISRLREVWAMWIEAEKDAER